VCDNAAEALRSMQKKKTRTQLPITRHSSDSNCMITARVPGGSFALKQDMRLLRALFAKFDPAAFWL
jgi:hypothetical protein